jgi:hypothetical protein
MSRRASGGALAACLIIAAIIGFAGGAYIGAQAGPETPNPEETVAAGTPGGDQPPAGGEEPETPASGLTLEAAQPTATVNGPINLTGTLAPAEAGVEVKVQRSVDGAQWADFPGPITYTTNDGGGFSGTIYSGQAGVNSIRVVRVDDPNAMSNVVDVTVS